MEFVELCENIIENREIENVKSIASKLGIKYNGIQEGYKHLPSLYLFTDSKTGSTFAVHLNASEKDISDKLEMVRKLFSS